MMGVFKDLLNLARKVFRELRGLVSRVNYDGSSSRNRGSSNGFRAIGSYK